MPPLAAPSPARSPGDPHTPVTVLQLDRLPSGVGGLPVPSPPSPRPARARASAADAPRPPASTHGSGTAAPRTPRAARGRRVSPRRSPPSTLLPPGSAPSRGMRKPAPPDIIREKGVLASSNPRRPLLVGRRPACEARGGGAPLFSFFSTLPQTVVCSLRQNRIKCHCEAFERRRRWSLRTGR